MDYLTTLPVELIHKILDNVPTLDILSSVFLVNKRLRSVSMVYPWFQLNFTCVIIPINKSQFDYICSQLLNLTSQIISLTLFDKDDPTTPMKNDLFFSKFNNIDITFSNLRSLTLTYIDYDTWCVFKTRLPLLIVKLSIHLVHNDRYASSSITSYVLCELLLFSLSLKYLSVKMSNYSNDTVIVHHQNPTILSSVQYFHLEGITIDLSSLFIITPMLHTLEISFRNLNRIFDTIHHQPLDLKRLRIDAYAITWLAMVILLSSFPRLDYLTVIADDLNNDMADGIAWAELLQEVKHFECKLQFYWDAFTDEPINLNSFRTKFWLEEKKWFLSYESISNTNSSILYSNSSSTIDYSSNEIIGILVSESTKLEPISLSHVHCLMINYQYVKYALLHRYTEVKQLNLSSFDTMFSMTFKDIVMYLDISRIVTCYPSVEWITKSTSDIIKFLQNLPYLSALCVSGPVLNYLFFHQWHNIVHLRIENDFDNRRYILCSNTIDAIGHSFTRLERLDFHLACVDDLRQILNRIMKTTLIDIFIRQPLSINSKRFVSYEWIKCNTELKNFYYACDAENSVSLWL
ncbi:unnamed protein product [Rotaria sordida]|uniref:F-box domain-containing protein n=1 Tax=Rotaria sordida TaxID=392033 RepID=A0A818P838_9BILA|nr:unnamed protein product [Rotaria sordida]